jgi:hypothetical protein
VILGLAAAGAVTAAIVVTVSRSGDSPARKSVKAYIVSVDRVQGEMQYPLTQVLTAYREFAKSSRHTSPALAQKLVQSERTLATLDRRLAALPAPPPAARLRTLLLRLVGAETTITHEVAQLARFAPRFGAVIADTRRASAVLAKRLAAVHPPQPHVVRGTKKKIAKARAAFASASNAAAAAQAAAVEEYDAAIARALRRLRTLDPPRALAPSYRSQVRALQATYVAGGLLAAELRSRHRSRVPQLARAFTVASRLSGTVAAQRAEVAAIKAYDKRARSLGAAAAAVQAEVARLQQTLP